MSSPAEICNEKSCCNSIEDKVSSKELGKLFDALAKAQLEMGVAKTDKVNPFFKSKYADLASVVRSSRPSLSKHGLSVIQRTDSIMSGDLLMYTRLCHSSGQWIESSISINPVKSDIQSLGSYLTYIKRYMYSAITGTVSSDEDDDGEIAMKSSRKVISPKKISDRELKTISEMLSGSRDIVGKVMKQFSIDKFFNLDAERFNECINFILKLKKESASCKK